MVLLAVLTGLGFAPVARAQVRPQPGIGDPRLQSVEYNPDQVVQLSAAPGYQLTIEFAPDEHIDNVAIGDSGAWQVTPNRRGDHLFIKALQPGVTTNMTVVTDVRTYAFDLTSLYGPLPDMPYTVRFRYPTPGGAVLLTGPAPSNAPDEAVYRVSGDRALRPSAVSDDGQHTFIEWPADRTLPAIYTVDSHGKEMLANGIIRDGLYVIDAVVSKLVFRIDKQVARAVREVVRKKR